MDFILDSCTGIAAPDTLLVLLAGAYGKPQDFMAHGFVQAVRTRRIAADMVMVDAHVAYYTAQTIVQRLHCDVIVPARARGVRQVWLVGISLGGYGAVLYSRQHCEQIDGLFLLAPFLGNRSVIAEIDATGLAAWPVGGAGERAEDDRALWAWLQGYAQEGRAPVRRPPLYLAYGLQDRFVRSSRLLGAVLPPQQVDTVAGGHDWRTWRVLWEAFLQRDILPR